ncbi:MAG: Wzz/FepE/Etk N-terminal domain-containing protein [Nocardioides sp.]
MQSEHPAGHGHSSISRAVRHHPAVVIVLVVVGAALGLLYAASLSTTYTSTAAVLVNPSVGNPFVPSPSAVRQDELTSLETEAQVASSTEVLQVVFERDNISTPTLEKNLTIVVPPNTQTLEISYTSTNADTAQKVANDVATTYLANRAHRSADENAGRIDRLAKQTDGVVSDLRAATFAAQTGSPANQAFQNQLATALRNQLVSLRAQRTALENSDVPAGTVLSPATRPKNGAGLTALIVPVGGVLAGLALGCLVALLMERLFGSIRAPREVEELGLPVAAAVPAKRLPLLHRHSAEAFDTTIRRLRALVLELEPRPNVITVAPPGGGRSDADVSEAVAESFAKAGHRVVLVRTDDQPGDSNLAVADGLAQALLYERLNVMELLEPTREPLLCLLPGGGFTAQSREFLTSARLRSVLAPLVDAGNLVVIQAPGLGSVEGEAMASAADLCLVAVTTRRTRPAAVDYVVRGIASKGTPPLAALVVGRRDAARRTRLSAEEEGSEPTTKQKANKSSLPLRSRMTRTKR